MTEARAMAATGQQGAFPPGFVQQVEQFFKTQEADEVRRLVCYDRDGAVQLTIILPIADPAQAAAQYRQAWQLWRDGGSVLRLRTARGEGLPQNEDRQALGEMPDFGLAG